MTISMWVRRQNSKLYGALLLKEKPWYSIVTRLRCYFSVPPSIKNISGCISREQEEKSASWLNLCCHLSCSPLSHPGLKLSLVFLPAQSCLAAFQHEGDINQLYVCSAKPAWYLNYSGHFIPVSASFVLLWTRAAHKFCKCRGSLEV